MAEAVDLVVVSLLLGIVAYTDDYLLCGDDWAGILGCDFKFAVSRGDGSDDGLAILEREMEGLGRDDGSHGFPLKGDVPCKFGLEQKSFRVGLDDGSGQAVAIFESHLIG
jgi:hypothetical protein